MAYAWFEFCPLCLNGRLAIYSKVDHNATNLAMRYKISDGWYRKLNDITVTIFNVTVLLEYFNPMDLFKSLYAYS